MSYLSGRQDISLYRNAIRGRRIPSATPPKVITVQRLSDGPLSRNTGRRKQPRRLRQKEIKMHLQKSRMAQAKGIWGRGFHWEGVHLNSDRSTLFNKRVHHRPLFILRLVRSDFHFKVEANIPKEEGIKTHTARKLVYTENTLVPEQVDNHIGLMKSLSE